jgi:hypothetical protein
MDDANSIPVSPRRSWLRARIIGLIIIAACGVIGVGAWVAYDKLREKPAPTDSVPEQATVTADEGLREKWYAAARKGDEAVVQELLLKGVDVNAKTEYGVTALAFAAGKGHIAVVRLLLENKADVNTKDTFYGSSPLDNAATNGHAKVVELLLESGAQGADDNLQTAVAMGKLAVVKAILDTAKPKEEVLTRALAAAPAKSPKIADALIKAGAKPAAAAQPEKTAVTLDRETLAAYAGTYRNEGGAGL